jgi:peptide chain release factor 2
VKYWCDFDLDSKRQEIDRLEAAASTPSFWDSHQIAQERMKVLSSIKSEVLDWTNLNDQIQYTLELLDLSIDEGDFGIGYDVRSEIPKIQQCLSSLEFKLTLSGAYDGRDAIVALHAGAGGVDSQDWAAMLTRMYIKWSQRRGYKCEVLDRSYGEEAGIKSVVLQITGDFAYGHLRSEKGVHRLVRLSPFDNDHARHTSFALAEVMPKVEQGVDVEINSDDLRVDVFRAGGHGGQSVQKNSTAVRITHIPTGTVVACQNERSQHQNREIAMRILTARLLEIERRKKQEEMAELKGAHISAEWGNQIRSYVLHPYQMVKDHRTGLETSDTADVLDGNLDAFITAFLTEQLGSENS